MKIRPKLRDGFWLVVVVALAVGWFIDHKRLADQQVIAQQQMAKLQHKQENVQREMSQLLTERRDSIRQPSNRILYLEQWHRGH